MADFRKWILALTVLVLFVGLASAQVGTGSVGGLTCVANAGTPTSLRSEGFTELVGDIVLDCTGGPTPGTGTAAQGTTFGSVIPTATVTVYLSGTVTSRLLNSTAGATSGAFEALLMIDDPGGAGPSPTGAGSNVPLTLCTSAAQAAIGCTEYIGNNTLGGINVPVQSVATGTPGWNAFQGTVSGSSVSFYSVPILAPGTTGTRVFRITNVRVNAFALSGGSGPIPTNVTAAIQVAGSVSVPVTPNQANVGFINQSLSQSAGTVVRNVSGNAFSNAAVGLTYPLQCTTPALAPPGSAVGNGKLFAQAYIRFAELFPSAFKTRVMPATLNPNGSGGTGQSGNAVQDVPGYAYNSESGFIVPGLTNPGGTATAGLADFGTRLQATFNNIPSGVSVYVSTSNMAGTTQVVAPTTSYAVLVASPTAPELGINAPAVTATGTTTNGGQGVQPLGTVSYYQLPTVANSATAVWEVVNDYTAINENLDFVVWLSYTASPGTNSPSPGTMTVNLAYAPNPSYSSTFTANLGGTASNAYPIPRFADTSLAVPIAQVTICQTSLLFPYVTNMSGFDTGIAIANTSVDPFSTAAQAGTCALNWYGNSTIASNPTASTLGAAGIGSTAVIPAGVVVTALASTTVPGFQGYMIAVCNFQFAHGFAFISDLGARNLAMGYLALIMNQPSGSYRPTGLAEALEQ